MAKTQGLPIWYELVAADPDAAARFYSDVVGWKVEDSGMEGMDYRMLNAADGSVGGLMKMPDGMEGGPIWMSYLGVDDVDASVNAIEEAGGTVHKPAWDIPGVGRVAMLADPHGAMFYVMRPEPPQGDTGAQSTSFQQGDKATPGHAVWNELVSPDPAEAIRFYADTLGWRQEGSMPMGDMGTGDYQFLHAGEVCLGGVLAQMPEGRTGWQVSFLVADLDAAMERLRAAGGKVVHGPDPIPGGGRSIDAVDPQGACFGLVE